MAQDMNRVMLIGNVGAEPEVRYFDKGVAMATLRLATKRRGYTLQNGTVVPDQTEWHNILFWRELAERVERNVHKGDKLFVEGSIHTRTYDDKNGVKRYRTEVWADTMEQILSKPFVANTPNESQSTSGVAETAHLPFA